MKRSFQARWRCGRPFFLLLLMAVLGPPVRADLLTRPHVVVFLSDDHTWRDSSIYGSTEIETPGMERLAKDGMTFDRAFVNSPTCAPARAALLTGLYPANNGAEANHSRPHADIKKLPAYFQQLGYEVVSFGKVGHYVQTPEYGFDIARHYGYHEDIAIPRAIEWLRQRQSEKPLFLMVGTNWPHVPWPEDSSEFAPDELQVPPTHVDNPTTRAWRARYLAAVRIMDDELGMVYDAAREKLGENLVFLHTSDHGAQWPFSKWNLYEDGIRTPLIVTWPGKIPPATRTRAMVSWIDILPTLVEAAGGQAPEDIDGRSFLPVLRGEKDTHRDVIFATHSGDGNNNVFPIRSVRTADGWKYIRNLHPEFRFTSHVTRNTGDSGYWDSWLQSAVADPAARERIRAYQQRPAEELYHLDEDPWELSNLIDDPAHAARVADLSQRLDRWMEETQDPQQVFGIPKKIAATGRPNIITVLVDDMGWSDLSCFGGDVVQTKNIDRLAAEGIRFTQFYVNSPICSPTRVALTTGQYPHRWRITSYLARRQLNIDRGMAQWLDPAAPVAARELQQNGYATGHFGKWHMGGQRDVNNAPPITEYGFDRSLTNFEGMGPKLLPLTLTPTSENPGRIWQDAVNLGGPVTWMQRSEITAGFVDAALEFIDRAQATGQPFFVNVWPDDVHSPFFPPLDRWGDDKRALYYGVLKTMDEQLGVLFDRIRNDDQLRNNTLIVFFSDNGHEPGAGKSDPLRGAKTWLYEGGIRSPLIVWGPGLVAEEAAGTINDQSVFSAIDVNRAYYGLTDTSVPEGHDLDGENVAATMLGKSTRGRQTPVFFRRPPDRPGDADQDNPDLAVRDGKWKFLINYDGSDPQLYDVVADVSESNNLAGQFPDVVQRLKRAVFEWNAGMPPDAGDPNFEKQADADGKELGPHQFVNPIGEGADPWVVRDPNADRYLWCFSEGNRGIVIHTSTRLTSLGRKHVVWNAPEHGPVSRQVWAPELHFLDGKWHIYFAASDGKNENHLAYVLVSEDADPLGTYTLHGPLETGDRAGEPIWAIDMTVLEHEGRRYALWSGWDEPDSDRQFLYAAAMKSPTEVIPPRVRICSNDDFPWEFTENAGRGRGLNEAPQVLKTDRRTFVLYSCGASWLPTYKLGRLELTGRNPLDPDAWLKHDRPVFTSTETTFGVGHSCFVPSPDGSQWWHVYHAKRDREPGWRRWIFVQPMDIGPQGFPRFFRPVAPGVPLDRPAGEPPFDQADLPYVSSLDASSDDLDCWSSYGHHQAIAFEADGLHLGRVPKAPINDYRSGEKVMFERKLPEDLAVEVTIDFRGDRNARDAGVLFRTTGPSVGYDAQRGYFVGLIPRTGLVIFGKTDGQNWTELARAATDIDPANPQRLRVEVRGHHVTALHNGREALAARDQTYATGQVGLRVVDTHAVFSGLRIERREP
jgi:arylsulfatase A-like enzyme/GH43 family beta-xylosidase